MTTFFAGIMHWVSDAQYMTGLTQGTSWSLNPVPYRYQPVQVRARPKITITHVFQSRRRNSHVTSSRLPPAPSFDAQELGPCCKHQCVSFSAPETIVTAFAASVDHTDTNLRCKSALSLHRPITVISIDTAAAIPPTRPSDQRVILIQGVVKAFWRARGERNTHRKPGTNMAASLNKAVTFCSSTPPPFRGETPIVSCL